MGSIYQYSENELPRKKARMEDDDSSSSIASSAGITSATVAAAQNGSTGNSPLQSSTTVALPLPPQPRALGPTGMGLEDSNSPERLRRAMDNIMDLKVFLITAPACFDQREVLRRFHLPTDEEVSCVRWNNVFYITGTDIVRCLTYRFAAFGRVITNKKKFEEGVFSDLRNLKNNMDATLENPRSEFLEFLYKNRCVRTKKKQKVFFWYSVRHERLFIDALERDLRKESSRSTEGTTTAAVSEPALSFRYDGSRSLNDQIQGILGTLPTPLAAIANATLTAHNGSVMGGGNIGVGIGPGPVHTTPGQQQQPMHGLPPPPISQMPQMPPHYTHHAHPQMMNPHKRKDPKLPPTPVFGGYQTSAQDAIDEGLEVDFFKESDFPLDFLRKEDIRAGNTPTTSHFPMYPEELYDYSRPNMYMQQQQPQQQGLASQAHAQGHAPGHVAVKMDPGAPQQPGAVGGPQSQVQEGSSQLHPPTQQAQQSQPQSGQQAPIHATTPQAQQQQQMQMQQMQMQGQYPYFMVPYIVPQGQPQHQPNSPYSPMTAVPYYGYPMQPMR